MRPANIVTAIADILAGVAVSGLLGQYANSWAGFPWQQVALLVASTIGLYGGGVVFNDVFDVEEDRRERPERPLPSGKVQLAQAISLGIALLVAGISAAAAVSLANGFLALAIALMALFYDRYAKHHNTIGPIAMGLCRSGNLLLGMSIYGTIPTHIWYIACIPLLFIAAITLTSQKETTGQNKGAVATAMVLDGTIVLFFVGLGLTGQLQILPALPFLIFWYGINLRAKYRAWRHNQPKLVMQAVKMGVLSLIPLNACYVAGFAGWPYALGVLLLLPVSLLLAKKFSVT